MAQLVLVARRSNVSRPAGLLRGAAVALSLVGRRGDLGLGITFAAPGLAVCALTGVLVGELLGNPSAARTRTALLEVRTASDYLPRAMTYWLLGLTAMLAVVLTTTSLVADPDDGRAGHAFTVACGTGATQRHSIAQACLWSRPASRRAAVARRGRAGVRGVWHRRLQAGWVVLCRPRSWSTRIARHRPTSRFAHSWPT